MMHHESFDPRSVETPVEVLRHRALHQPDKTAFIFLEDGEQESDRWTYAQLDLRARAIAARLQEQAHAQERALLLYPQGLEFLAAFYGCLYSGVMAIPVPLPFGPGARRLVTRVESVVQDAQARWLLTTAEFLPALRESNEVTGRTHLSLVATDSIDNAAAETWREYRPARDQVAYLQYTSGSTSSPKGVMVGYDNLMANLELVSLAVKSGPESCSVMWVPNYHDWGLVDGLLSPVYVDYPCVFFPPMAFMRRPVRWLRAISKYRATHSGGPTFAYELAVEKTKPADREDLDLSCWQFAGVSAEPISVETIERFTSTFGPYGLSRQTMAACFGLAEATLVVTARQDPAKPLALRLNAAELDRGRAVEALGDQTPGKWVVSCGPAMQGTQLVIVDPQTLERRADGEVGEIWLKGPSITHGYWNRPEETRITFDNYLADTAEGPFLRTGDLGFLREGELFVTGRIKDLIIVAGANHYPQDIEITVQRSHCSVRPGCVIACSLEVEGEERVLVVAESTATAEEASALIEVVREQVAQAHDLAVFAVVVLSPGALPKTSSGKLQRHACRQDYWNGFEGVVAEWRSAAPLRGHVERGATEGGDSSRHSAAQSATATLPPAAPTSANNELATADADIKCMSSDERREAIENWLRRRVAELAGIDPSTVDLDQAFALFGLVSRDAVAMAMELEDWLGQAVSPTLIYEYSTIETLAAHLAASSEEERERVG